MTDELGANTAADETADIERPVVEPAAATTPPPSEPPSAEPERHRARSIIAAVLGVLTVLVLILAVVTVWARATVLRPEPIARLAGDVIAEPEVQTALADRLAAEVTSATDLQARLTEILPDQLDRFAPSIAAGAQSAIERVVAEALSKPEVHDAFERLVERAHGAAMKLLEGDGLADGVSVQDGVVTLNLLPVLSRGFEAVQNLGLLTGVQLPEMTADGDPQQQIAALSQALNRDLPADFGQVTVYQSEKLANAQANLQMAQDMLVLAKRAVWLLVILFVLLAVATILVAANRWRALLILGVGVAGGMAVLRTTIREVVATGPSLVAKPGGKTATRVILSGATSSLLKLAGLMLLIGLLAATIAILRRRQWRRDLTLVVAVAAGVAVPAIAGLHIWSAVVGLALGIAVPFLARWLLPPTSGGRGGETTPVVAGSDTRVSSPKPATA